MRLIIILLTMLVFPILKAETIRIGTLPYNPPFEMEADKKGHFFGFDVDIVMEACKRIQADCHFIPLTFSKIFTELVAGHIDLGLGAISITESREQTFLFSLPYLASSGQFITNATSPFKTINDFEGKKIGSVQGTLFKSLVLERTNHQVQVIEFATITEAFEALSSNEVHAVIADEGTAKYWVAENGTLFKLIGSAIPVGIGYGVMANKSGSDLIKRLNSAFMDMEADGSYLKIYTRYFSKMSIG